MTLQYIRDSYKVPAFRGAKVEFQGVRYTIVGSRGATLRIKDAAGKKYTVHPTWELVYLPKEKPNV